MATEQFTLPVNEIFGPTLQGEGPDIGKACVFLRLHSCPVQCPGCDTGYTWNGTERGNKMNYREIMDKMLPMMDPGVGIVVSGGEPLLYYRSILLRQILGYPDNPKWKWAGLETSGYAGDQPLHNDSMSFFKMFTSVSLSPKITPCLHGRQTDEQLERNFEVIERDCRWTELNLNGRNDLSSRLFYKFVVRDQRDIDAILACDSRHHFIGNRPVYLMPYGNDRDEIFKCIETLIPAAAKYGFIITPRLQALLWGKTRGV